MADTTILTLSAMDVTPYSARGLRQSFEPISAAPDLRRTINGVLNDLSLPQFKKYRTTINGDDQQPPAIDGIWPGLTVTVGCLFELAYKTVGGSPQRPVVAGSSRTEGDFTFYRPTLTCKITSYSVDEDEYGKAISWMLELEEV
jgi:hypothetical protein